MGISPKYLISDRLRHRVANPLDTLSAPSPNDTDNSQVITMRKNPYREDRELKCPSCHTLVLESDCCEVEIGASGQIVTICLYCNKLRN